MEMFFTIVISFLIVQRLLEVRLSTKNEAYIIKNGGMEYAPEHFIVMKMLHTLWFVTMIVEFVLNKPEVSPVLSAICFAGMLLGQTLRYAAIRTLGKRWTVKIFVLPTAPAVNNGIFKYIKHPNYLGVIIEIFTIPMIFGLTYTAVAFSIANALLLVVRIRKEEEILSLKNDYRDRLNQRPRFLPFL